MRAWMASSTVSGEADLCDQAIDVDDPCLDLGELVLDLDDVHVVEDADHALEQRRDCRRRGCIAASTRSSMTGRLAARREEILHDARGVGLAEGRELDDLVARRRRAFDQPSRLRDR